MMDWMKFEEEWSSHLLSVLRIATALLFLEHGTAKLFEFPHIDDFDSLRLFSLSGVAGVIEVAGGLLVALGLFTRPAAFILSGEMAVAYFMVHAPLGFFPILNNGEAAVFYCFAFLYLSVAGGGAWTVDRLMRPQMRELS
jgi:putative oxidoreductase